MTQNGTSSFTVSLRPPTNDVTDVADDLLSKIRLINQQRDGFRNVTEESLQLEMNEMHDGASSASDPDEEGEDEEQKDAIESIFNKRMQMLHSLRSARDNGLFALDTLSLAASRSIDQSFQTASPAIKEMIPPGSLSFRRRDYQDQSSNAEESRKRTQLWTGSSMTNNTDATDTLLAAATRLEGLVKAETEYWGQLLSLTTHGWPVYKPGPMEAIHVRFVANEASNYYKMQGVARLTPDKNGTVKLGSRVGAEPRTLRMKLRRDGEDIASSVTTSLLSLADLGSSLEDKVRKEQSSLFEEELFQEMILESRTLQPLGVKLRESVLHLPLKSHNNTQEEYLIDLIPVDDASGSIQTSDGARHKELLDAQAVLLRLLLCHVYHLRLEKRSRPPPPLSDNDRKAQTSNIIRSFLAVTQHQITCKPLAAYLSDLSDIASKAGLPLRCFGFKVPGLRHVLDSLTSTKSTIHQMLAGASKPQVTEARIKVTEQSIDGPSAEHTILVRASTDLSAPTFGTEFTIDLPLAIARLRYGPESHERKVTLSCVSDVKAFLTHLLSLQIVQHYLLPQVDGWTANHDMPVLERKMGNNGSQRKIIIGVKIEDSAIELRRRLFSAQKNDQSREVWSKTSSNGKALPAIFAAWVAEES